MVFASPTILHLFENVTFLGDFPKAARGTYDIDCDGTLEASERAEYESRIASDQSSTPPTPASFIDGRPFASVETHPPRVVGLEAPTTSNAPFTWVKIDVINYDEPDSKLNHTWIRPAVEETAGVVSIIAPIGYSLAAEGLLENATINGDRTAITGWRDASQDLTITFHRIGPATAFDLRTARNLSVSLENIHLVPSIGEIVRSRTIEWGDGTISKATHHQYDHPGEYRITLLVEDSANMTASAVRVVSVEYVAPAAAFDVRYEDSLVVSFDASATVPGDGGIERVLWDFGDGSMSEGMRVRHVFPRVGTFNVALRIEDDKGSTGRVTREITPISDTVPPVPVMRLDVDFLQATANASESFDGNGAIHAYVWDWGDGSPASSGPVMAHTYASPGEYIVQLTVVSDKGATVTTAQSVLVFAAAEIPLPGVGFLLLFVISLAVSGQPRKRSKSAGNDRRTGR